MNPPIPILGLLGAPGSGKSYVSHELEKLGAKVIDADALARAALDDPSVIAELRDWWGPEVVLPDGRVDRAAVGRRVFDSPAELARLESLVHPRVNAQRAELRRRYRADPTVTAIVEDCPLLLERALERDCDALVFVEASRQTREARVREKRGWSAEELTRREKNQWPLDMKRGRADYVIDNDAPASPVPSQVRRLLDWAIARLASSSRPTRF